MAMSLLAVNLNIYIALNLCTVILRCFILFGIWRTAGNNVYMRTNYQRKHLRAVKKLFLLFNNLFKQIIVCTPLLCLIIWGPNYLGA